MTRKIIISGLVALFLFNTCAQHTKEVHKDSYMDLRKKMVEEQIKDRGIKDKKILDAMLKVERHKFVPAGQKERAYGDYPLPIGEGQTISQPYIVALMTSVLDLDGSEKILEIGTGSGYQAAVLAELADQVYTIEVIKPLAERAKKLLNELGYDNITVKYGDGYGGWDEHSPFDRIIVTCSPTHIPEELKDQLAEDGKMIIPVGPRFAQNLVLLNKKNGKVKKQKMIPVRFVPMINEDGKPY